MSIPTPYTFEVLLSDDEFQKLGQFASRWALIDHVVGNCLRVMLSMDPKDATVMIFPLSLDLKMARIGELIKQKQRLFGQVQLALFGELKPLIKAMQFLRNTVLHGIIVSHGDDDSINFHLRSKDRVLNKNELFNCEDLINYTAHITQAFRFSLGEKNLPLACTRFR